MVASLIFTFILFSFLTISRGNRKFPRYSSIFRSPLLFSSLELGDSSTEYEQQNRGDALSNPYSDRGYEKEILGQELQRHGTTTLALKLKKSIIICVDSKASIGTFVGSRTVRKIIPISSHMVATMAGGAADCYHMIRFVAAQAKIYELENGSPLPVSGVANLLASNLRQSSGEFLYIDVLDNLVLLYLLILGLSVGTMIAGYDALKGPSCKSKSSKYFKSL